jgi:ubiquitin C-terminal hydrolase
MGSPYDNTYRNPYGSAYGGPYGNPAATGPAVVPASAATPSTAATTPATAAAAAGHIALSPTFSPLASSYSSSADAATAAASVASPASASAAAAPAPGYKVAFRRPVGLVNLGNTCYFNSVLQALFSVPAVALGLAGSVAAPASATGSERRRGDLARAFAALLSNVATPPADLADVDADTDAEGSYDASGSGSGSSSGLGSGRGRGRGGPGSPAGGTGGSPSAALRSASAVGNRFAATLGSRGGSGYGGGGYGGGGGALNPSQVREVGARVAMPTLGGYGQEDAHECLRALVTALHEDTNAVAVRIATSTMEAASALGPAADAAAQARCLLRAYALRAGDASAALPRLSKPVSLPYAPLDDDPGAAEPAEAARWWRAGFANREVSPLSLAMAGQLVSTITCQGCGARSRCFEPFWDLSLPIPHGASTLSDCLRAYGGTETFPADAGGYRCPVCAKKKRAPAAATKNIRITRLPQVLVIHLKRFWVSPAGAGAGAGMADLGASGSMRYGRGGRGYGEGKITTPISVPPLLSLDTPTLDVLSPHGCRADAVSDTSALLLPGSAASGSADYTLCAAVLHHGSTGGGHYTAMGRVDTSAAAAEAAAAGGARALALAFSAGAGAGAGGGAAAGGGGATAGAGAAAGAARGRDARSAGTAPETVLSQQEWWYYDDSSATPMQRASRIMASVDGSGYVLVYQREPPRANAKF